MKTQKQQLDPGRRMWEQYLKHLEYAPYYFGVDPASQFERRTVSVKVRTAQEMQIECLKAAIDKTEAAKARAVIALVAAIEKLEGQKRELRAQEAIAERRRKGGAV